MWSQMFAQGNWFLYLFDSDTCWKDPIQYRGTLNITFDGKKCLNWKNGTPKYHNASLYPDSTVEKARNYCRSPNNDPYLWCFIPSENPGTNTLQYCGTPPCFGNIFMLSYRFIL